MSHILSETFPLTASFHSVDDDAIKAKYPFVCDRPSLVYAIRESGLPGNTTRNPNSYTAEQLADKIIDQWDKVMRAQWYNDYVPLGMKNVVDEYKWSQKSFWSHELLQWIYKDATNVPTAADILNTSEIVILPGWYYHPEDVKEYRGKSYLGFDYQLYQSAFGAEVELSPTSSRPIGILSGGLQIDDQNYPTPGYYGPIYENLMYIYNSNEYHPDFAPNGIYNSYYYGGAPADWSGFPSSKWYDKSVAEFEVTVTGSTGLDGVVTAITPVARPDGNGTMVTGGWAYYSDDNFARLNIPEIDEMTNGSFQPRVHFSTETDAVGYTGNQAIVDINDPDYEFNPGRDLRPGTYTAYAVRGLADHAIAGRRQEGQFFNNAYQTWYDRNWPTDPRPSSVRIRLNRPTLVSTTRSLKTVRVGTGAHAYSFEFEYPPLYESEFNKLLDMYEITRGSADALQIAIPSECIAHSESVFADTSFADVPYKTKIIEGTGVVGSGELLLDGFAPYYTIPQSFFIRIGGDNKIYRVLEGKVTDPYGRMAVKIEPPLQSNVQDFELNLKLGEFRSNYFLVKAYIVEDSLDYSVDAAGLYRVSIKFMETLD